MAFVACWVDGVGRNDSLTFGSGSAGTMTATTADTGSTDEGSSSGATTTTTDDGADTGSTSAPSTDTSGAIESSSGGDDGAAACPPVDPLDCSPGVGSGEADTCDLDGVSCFLPTVQASVQGIVNGHPEWFDMSAGTPFVLEPELYMDAVVADVSAAGLCAIRDPNAGDEIAVKHDNAYAESFDILSAEGNARWGEGIYTATCTPSWF